MNLGGKFETRIGAGRNSAAPSRRLWTDLEGDEWFISTSNNMASQILPLGTLRVKDPPARQH